MLDSELVLPRLREFIFAAEGSAAADRVIADLVEDEQLRGDLDDETMEFWLFVVRLFYAFQIRRGVATEEARERVARLARALLGAVNTPDRPAAIRGEEELASK